MSECWFAHVSPCEFRANGRLDRGHLIPQQRMKKAGIKSKKVLADPRSWRPMCRKHHHAFDNGFIEVTRDEIPRETEEFAKQPDAKFNPDIDLTWSLDRDYGDPA
jgi:hypothetical protein